LIKLNKKLNRRKKKPPLSSKKVTI